jgi:hypothetical protein
MSGEENRVVFAEKVSTRVDLRPQKVYRDSFIKFALAGILRTLR